MTTARPEVGAVYTHERTFTKADVRRFGELSGDQQPIHTDPNEDGKLVVQGLLTATIPTKIGGEIELLARSMRFEFRQPVYTGEPIECTMTVDEVEEREDRFDVTSSVVCRRDNETVMTADVDGLLWK